MWTFSFLVTCGHFTCFGRSESARSQDFGLCPKCLCAAPAARLERLPPPPNPGCSPGFFNQEVPGLPQRRQPLWDKGASRASSLAVLRLRLQNCIPESSIQRYPGSRKSVSKQKTTSFGMWSFLFGDPPPEKRKRAAFYFTDKVIPTPTSAPCPPSAGQTRSGDILRCRGCPSGRSRRFR